MRAGCKTLKETTAEGDIHQMIYSSDQLCSQNTGAVTKNYL